MYCDLEGEIVNGWNVGGDDVNCIGEEDTRNAVLMEDSSSTADRMKNGVDKGFGKSSAFIESLNDVVILW